MARILVIDDDVLVRKSFSRLFADMGHEVHLADSLAAGQDEVRRGVDVIYLDLQLPDGDGLKAIDALSAADGRPEVIVITGLGSHYGAQKTLRSNVWDYIPKPASPQLIKESLKSALKYRKEAQKEQVATARFNSCGIVAEDASMMRVLRDVEKAAGSDASVFISGETGVGKELIARAIHANSARKNAPFVVLDCSNMTDTLVESTLYGHTRGAFTGAHADQRGLVAEANGGTLFLDEVGELSLSLQKSFLRVLQERRYRPVGSSREQSSDFRLVTATNRDLNGMVQEGAFRSDVLFRIRTVEIDVPPLRERSGDRERLTGHFMDRFCSRYGFEPKQASAELLTFVAEYRWPGNVRELASVMEAVVINAGKDPVVYPKHLPGNVRLGLLYDRQERRQNSQGSSWRSVNCERNGPEQILTYDDHKVLRDREYFSGLLRASNQDITKVSQLSGLSVPSVYRHLALAGIPTKNKRGYGR